MKFQNQHLCIQVNEINLVAVRIINTLKHFYFLEFDNFLNNVSNAEVAPAPASTETESMGPSDIFAEIDDLLATK